MSKPIFVLDMDGCLASQGKIWHESTSYDYDGNIEGKVSRTEIPGILGVYKTISDHDSWAIDTIKKNAHILILSGDERINKAWAARREVDFIFTAANGFHGDKWDHLQKYLQETFGGKQYPEYYYLGDAMPDFECMKRAKLAFYPADACFTLIRAAQEHNYGCMRKITPNTTINPGNFHSLTRNSGCGVFEEMLSSLIHVHGLSEEIMK